MKKLLPSFLVAALCCLPGHPAMADVSTRSDGASMQAIEIHATPILLTDDALDTVNAAGIVASAYSLASADRGQVLSMSTTRIVSSRMVTFSLSQSLAFAIGMHPQTVTGATVSAF